MECYFASHDKIDVSVGYFVGEMKWMDFDVKHNASKYINFDWCNLTGDISNSTCVIFVKEFIRELSDNYGDWYLYKCEALKFEEILRVIS